MHSEDPSGKRRRGVSAELTVGIAIVVVLAALAVGIVVLFFHQSWKDLSPGQATLVASGGAIVVGGLALFGVWITRRGTEKNLDKQLAAQRVQSSDTHNRETVRDLKARYTTAAEQLVHDSHTIRVAGVYALASLADDWHSFGNDSERQVCIDLLCAQLRDLKPALPADAAVRSAIIKVIHQHTRPVNNELPENNWCKCTIDLRGADLSGVQLPLSVMFHPVLADSNLNHALLMGVQLRRAHLRGADLSGAMLGGAWLVECDLTDAIIDEETDLTDISHKDTLWPRGFPAPQSIDRFTDG